MIKKATLLILIITSTTAVYADDLHDISPETLKDKILKYYYEEQYYDGTGESCLTIAKTDTGYFIEWLGITDITRVYTDKMFNTLRMTMTDPDTELTVVREGDRLKIIGVDEGKDIEKVLKINSEYWYQLMPAQLSNFVKSDDTETEFSMFDPYNIQVMDMRVEKKGTEKIEVSGKEFEAVKMNMRIQGFLSLFWKSEIWYGRESRLQLRYEGVNVIPKLYNAVIEFKRADLGDSR